MPDSVCTEKCWTPVECSHGYEMPPAGRSAPLEAYFHDCDEVQSRTNTMHLWHEHDDTRWYHDPKGWEAHEASCDYCNPQDDDDA